MNAIPAMAAYESWKLTDRTESGSMMTCIRSEAISNCLRLCRRPVIRAASPRNMNMKARTIEGPAPVARV